MALEPLDSLAEGEDQVALFNMAETRMNSAAQNLPQAVLDAGEEFAPGQHHAVLLRIVDLLSAQYIRSGARRDLTLEDALAPRRS